MALAFWLILVFLTGASVGSFLNVSIARLPLEKSLLWPNSRCGNCLQSIAWYDNIPILAYLWLRGRCRTCGQHYSIAYLLVELMTALAFVGLFWLELVENVHGWPNHPAYPIQLANFPAASWLGFAWHALLMAFLIVATVCDLKSREIPLQLTLTGTLIGVIGSAFLPWPWPQSVGIVLPPAPPDFPWQAAGVKINQGIYAWPFWGPLPSWAGEGEWQTGLLTGVIGALVGTFLLRMVGFLFSKGLGKDALGIGDADLMMMAGAFMGWQIVVVAFFVSVFPALIFAIIQLLVRRDNSLPFGPALSLSVIATSLLWEPIGAFVRFLFFWGVLLFWAVVFIGGMLFLTSFVLRLLRGKEDEPS
jgi:leader peptidase (prepilin peptidase)/N-methyltransferase